MIAHADPISRMNLKSEKFYNFLDNVSGSDSALLLQTAPCAKYWGCKKPLSFPCAWENPESLDTRKIGNVIGYPMYSGNPPMQTIKTRDSSVEMLNSYKWKKFWSELSELIWKGWSMHQKPVDACTNCTGWKFGNSGNDWKSIPGTEFRSFSKSLFLFSCCLKSTCCCKRLKYLQYLKNGRYHWYYGSASFN